MDKVHDCWLKVFEMIKSGMGNRAIAGELGIEIGTVSGYRSRLKKLGFVMDRNPSSCSACHKAGHTKTRCGRENEKKTRRKQTKKKSFDESKMTKAWTAWCDRRESTNTFVVAESVPNDKVKKAKSLVASMKRKIGE